MNKVFLRRSNETNPLIPYTLESDEPNDDGRMELGNLVILLPFNDCPYIYGMSHKKNYGVRLPIGMVNSANDLTNKVYEGAVDFGKKFAQQTPGYEFVDETNGPKKIELDEL